MLRTTCLGAMSLLVRTCTSLTSPSGVATTRADSTPVSPVIRFSSRFIPQGSGVPLNSGGTPDPWGMKRLENLITGLTGVLSARVVATPLGEVSEVHVLTKSDMAPKQVVRNIESALMAQLGFKIDHRKISVAQTADVRPIEALQEEAIAERSKRRVVVFKHLEVRPSDRPQRVQMRVTLAFGEKEAQAEEVGT